MKWFFGILFSLIVVSVLFLLPDSIMADTVVNSDGYVQADGFYVKNGVSYTRDIVWYKDWVWVNPCRSCGGYWTFTWKYYYSYTAVILPAATDPEWRSRLLRIAAARDVAEGKLRYAAQEQGHFLEAVNALGLQGNFRYESYGRNPMQPTVYGNLQLGQHGVSGNSIYGYSYASVADAYGQTDLNALYNQSSRLTQNAQSLAGQANTEFSDLVKQAGGNAARVAEILAKGQAGRLVIDGINSPGTTSTTQIKQFGPTPTGPVPTAPTTSPSVETPVASPRTTFLQLSGPVKCIACHSGAKLEGNFDVTKVPQMSAEEIVTRVIPKLISKGGKPPDMPKGLPPLTAEEVRHFLGGR